MNEIKEGINKTGTKHKIIIGDSRKMNLINDESVHLIICSPPYYDIKDYGNSNQIGYGQTYTNYTESLNSVWKECYRTLHKGCKLCVNIGDQYMSKEKYGRYHILPIRTDIINFCQTIGFDFMGNIIWQKIPTMNPSGGGKIMGSVYTPRDGIIKYDFEYILIFKKYLKRGEKGLLIEKEIKEKSKFTLKDRRKMFSGIWHFLGSKQDEHPAVFPLELPTRLIKMYSFKGETILDCFLGSGTTMLASRNLDRNSIGYELNERNYLEIIKEKVKYGQKNLLNDVKFKILHDKK